MYNLKTTILTLPKIIGCEEFPKSEHGKLLVEDIENFINTRYQYSAKNIIDAFEAAATFTLFLDGKRVEPSTFGKFLSRASVGKVLTAYKESKQNKSARPSTYNPKQLNQAPVKLITPEEAWDLMLKFVKEDDGLPFCAPYLKCYEYLVEKQFIKPVRRSKGDGFSKNMVGPQRQAVEQYLLRNIINQPQTA